MRSREGGAPTACAAKPKAFAIPLQAVCGGVRRQAATDLSRSSHAAYFALMRASSVLPGFPTSEWRDSNPRPRGPQPRALPTAPHSVRTPAGTRTWIDGCDILPRLMRGGGFLLKNPFGGFSIDRLSPHALWFARFYESCRSISLPPSSRMFRAAFTSRSCRTPQDGHVHSRTDRFLTCGFR